MMDLDDLLTEIGQFGKYQKSVLWLVLLPCVFPCGFHAYNQLFMAAKPDHWCRVPELEDLSYEVAKNLSIPMEERDGEMRFSQCTMFNKSSTGEFNSSNRVTCQHGWIYDKTVYKNSVTTEWNLVCEDNILSTLALVAFGTGGLIGNYIFGYIQDRHGRKSAFFIYLFIQTVFGIATALASSFGIWVLFRFGVGFTIPSILSTPSILAIELVGPKYRSTVTVLINIAYSIDLIVLSIIVWAVRDWRQLALFTTVPFIALFALYWAMPESPRWLMARGDFVRAEKILNKMARVNKRTAFVSEIRHLNTGDLSIKSNDKADYGMVDLFKLPKLRLKTLIITFIWFTNTSVYVGLSYYAPALGGDEFFNFFLAGVAELPTYIFLWPAMERIGRRWILFSTMVVGGIACTSTLVINDATIRLGLYCVGKMGISASFVVLPLMASETYPTVVRGIGMSLSSVAGMLGPVFIPLINYLGARTLTLPLIIMGALLIAGGLSSLLLPETLRRNLPQTLEDAEKDGLVDFRWWRKYEKRELQED
ncbi:beta-alanine transporter isoform X1 [Photinus pyralis]|nr:beta-alanine transporter isoform X1 [Photinus pyralis]XP_031348589.1 beta-alanine transporter isoform X1 [Photinus pyralis]